MQKYEHLKDIPIFSTIIVILFGLWGAILNFAKREEEVKNYSFQKKIMLFFIDLLTSGGFALLTYYGLVGYGFNEPISVAIAGAVAHQGTRLIYIAELIVASKFGGETVVEAVEKEKQNDK
jgi:hypothetical protein